MSKEYNLDDWRPEGTETEDWLILEERGGAVPKKVARNLNERELMRCLGIRKGTPAIDDFEYFGLLNLEELHIPFSVFHIGTQAFGECMSLELITVDRDNPIYDSRDCNAIFETSTDTLIRGCMTTVIPESTKAIADHAFDGCNFTEYYEIDRNLGTIRIPKNVERIGKCIFYDARCLNHIYVSPYNKIFDSRNNCDAVLETATNTLICGCSATKPPAGLEHIGDYAFCGCRYSRGPRKMWLDDTREDNKLLIPDGVKSIGDSAFQECTGFIEIFIPASVIHIGNKAFEGCSARIFIDPANELHAVNPDGNVVRKKTVPKATEKEA